MNDDSIVKQWLKLANGDLDVANHLLSLYPPQLEIICYHCEQAAEKMLKAFIAAQDIPVSKTHDLSALRRLCAEYSTEFEALDEMCARLTPYGVQVRYPSDIEITEEDMQLALRDAEQVAGVISPLLAMEQLQVMEQENHGHIMEML